MVHPTNKKGVITSGFGLRNGSPHNGIDIGTYGNVQGLPIYAAWSGTVSNSTKGCIEGNYNCGLKGGNWVEIVHGGGYKTRYLHLKDNYTYKGQKVKAGQKIGTLGNTGYSTGAHLHFEIWKNGAPINPGAYLQNAQSVNLALSNNSSDFFIIGLLALILLEDVII